jgi:hypothetical protein
MHLKLHAAHRVKPGVLPSDRLEVPFHFSLGIISILISIPCRLQNTRKHIKAGKPEEKNVIKLGVKLAKNEKKF